MMIIFWNEQSSTNTSKVEDGEIINNNISSFTSFNLPFVMNIDRYGVHCFCLSYESYQ